MTRYDIKAMNTRAVKVEFRTDSHGGGYLFIKDLYRKERFRLDYYNEYNGKHYSNEADQFINYLLSIGILEHEIISFCCTKEQYYIVSIANFDINLKTGEKY